MNQFSIKQINLMIACLLIFLFNSSQCYAEENLERAWDFGIGFGYGNSSNPFIGADDIPSYLSLDIAVYGENFFFDNGELGYTLLEKQNFGLNLITTYNSERIYYSYLNNLGLSIFSSENSFGLSSNSPFVALDEDTVVTFSEPLPPILPSSGNPFPLGNQILPFSIANKRWSLNMGFELIYDSHFGSINYQYTQNVNKTHSGSDMILGFTKNWQKKRWGFSSTVTAHWKSAQLVNYYYGVGEVYNSLFDIDYHPGSSIDVGVNLTANYRLTNHLSLVASVKFNKFASAIKNSPIIDESFKSIIFTGLYYRF